MFMNAYSIYKLTHIYIYSMYTRVHICQAKIISEVMTDSLSVSVSHTHTKGKGCVE